MTNIINWTNTTNINQILPMANTTTGGWFWAAMLIMLYFVLMLSLLNFGFEMSLLTSSFICFILALMLYMMGGLVTQWIVLVFLGIVLFTILYIYTSSTRENV
jgi:hypothetical protein